jgi:hypothetical protein
LKLTNFIRLQTASAQPQPQAPTQTQPPTQAPTPTQPQPPTPTQPKTTLHQINATKKASTSKGCSVCNSHKCHQTKDRSIEEKSTNTTEHSDSILQSIKFNDINGNPEIIGKIDQKTGVRSGKETNRQQVISVDSGRKNIVAITEMAVDTNGVVVVLSKYRLPKWFYLKLTGAIRYTREIDKIQSKPEVIEAEEYLRTHPLKLDMSNEEKKKWIEMNKVLSDSFATIEHCKLKYQKEYKKQKALERHLIKICTRTFDGYQAYQSNVLVVYGSAKFPSTAKGEAGGSPTVSIRQLFQRLFTTVLIDEYYTSQKCSTCEHQLMEIRQDNRVIRDYRCCVNCCCNVDRDYNACVNIIKAAIGWRIKDGKPEGRPEYLNRKKVQKP